MLNGFLHLYQARELHHCVEFSLGVVEVSLGFQAFHLDAVNVVEDGRFYDVIHCSQVDFDSLVHAQNLPV